MNSEGAERERLAQLEVELAENKARIVAARRSGDEVKAAELSRERVEIKRRLRRRCRVCGAAVGENAMSGYCRVHHPHLLCNRGLGLIGVILVMMGCVGGRKLPVPERVKFRVMPIGVVEGEGKRVVRWPISGLPEFRMPVGWETNRWRVERSYDLVHWEGVSGWKRGRGVGLLLEERGCGFLRLATYKEREKEEHEPDRTDGE